MRVPTRRTSHEAQRALASILRATLVFTLAWLAFLSLTDIGPVEAATHHHLLLGLSWLATSGGAFLTLLVVMAVGVPLVMGAMAKATFSRRGDVWPALVPFLAIVLFFLSNGMGFAGTGVLAAVFPTALCWLIGLLSAIVGTSATVRLIARNITSPVVYRVALVTVTIALPSMLLALGGMLCWGVLATLVVPGVLVHAVGPLGLPVWCVWALVTVATFGAMGASTVGLARGIFTRAVIAKMHAGWLVLLAAFAFGRGVLFGQRPEVALAYLRERYARGEIEIETFAERARGVLARRVQSRGV